MKLIFKYLKPYILVVLLIVGFTYVQVQTELALPDYMSDIVTNGIQYGGIEDEIPTVISEDDMNDVLLFVEENQKEEILSNFDYYQNGTKAVVDNQEIEFNSAIYIVKNEDYESDILKQAEVYAYIAEENAIEVNSANVNSIKEVLDEKLVDLQDNYDSMLKFYVQDVYKNVGVNVSIIQSNYILHLGLIMLLISLLSVFATIGATYLSTKVSMKIATKMRKDVFEKVESFSSSEFSTFSTSSLITRTGNDITKIQNLIQTMLRMMLMAPLMGITAVFKVIRYPNISWILLVAVGIMIATMIVLIVVAFPNFEKIQKLVDKINNIMREYLDGILVIRAFNQEKNEEEKFDEANREQTRLDRFISRVMGITMPVMTFIMNGLTIIITWIAAYQINIDALSIGDMMAFIQYAIHVVMSFMFVAVMFFMVPRSLVSAKRINEVLDTKLTILDPENSIEMSEENGTLEFDHVYFRYPGAEEYILTDINFKAEPGETIALIGSTGSGKSTVIKLIPRLFDIEKGSIKYCGHDIREYRQTELRDKIGFASQKAILFSGTIESNISFGRDVSKEELDEAIKVSQSENIIAEKEKGVNDAITQGGTNVSGGQKQRLSIARALAKRKNIYMFDDSFSALDYETDKKLRNELTKLIKKTKATVFIVAQRIATIKNADKIIVFEEGKIVGMGSHNELLRDCKVYQEIASSQLSKEELENARA